MDYSELFTIFYYSPFVSKYNILCVLMVATYFGCNQIFKLLLPFYDPESVSPFTHDL